MRSLLRTFPEKMVFLTSLLLSKVINRNKNLHAISVKKILVIKLDEIGDMCYALHVFDMLKAQFPEAEITLLCKSFVVSMVKTNPAITKVVTDFNDLTGDYDIIIDLRGNWKSIGYALKHMPKIRLDRGTVRFANMKKGKHPHEVITNLAIVAPIIQQQNQHTLPKLHIAANSLKQADDYLLSQGIKQFALLHCGARRALRKWNQFDLLATYLKSEMKLDIIFIGDKFDTEDITQWQQKIPFTTYSTAGIFDLSAFAALATRAALFVGNESGPLHIAAASQTPSVGLFGPGEPIVFYPWGEHTKYVHHVLPCNPCNQLNCIHPDNPCINRIELAEVIQHIKNLTDHI